MDIHDSQSGAKNNEEKTLRAKLLDLKIEKCSDFGEVVAYLDLLIPDRSSVHGIQINDESVKAIDNLLIWFSRAMQYLKHQKSVNYDFHQLEGRLEDIFHLIDDLHHSSLGSFSNALTTLLKKLLQFAELIDCSDDFIKNIVQKTKQRPATDKSFFVIIETILKLVTKSTSVIRSQDYYLEDNCLKAMKHGALANSASKCISLYYRRQINPQEAPTKYMQLWASKLDYSLRDDLIRDKIITHLIPMLFRDIPNQFLTWIKTLDIDRSDPQWPKVVLPLLLAGLDLSKLNDPFNDIISESDIERFLCDKNNKVRLGAFSFITSIVHASSPPPSIIRIIFGNSKLLDSIVQELQTPDDRTTFVFHLRSMLLKIKAYATKIDKNAKNNAEINSTEVNAIFIGIYNYVRSILIPDSSYAQLSIATEVASFLITDEFDGILRDPKLKNKGPVLVSIYTKDFIRTLLRLNSNNYDDIRRRCSSMLSYCSYLELTKVIDEFPALNSLKLIDGSKQGAVDSFADLFLTIAQAHAKNSPESYTQLLSEVMSHLESRYKTCASICGSMAVLSSILSVATPSIIKQFHDDFKSMFDRILDILDKQWSEFYSSQDGTVQTGDKLDNWRSFKETFPLIETLLTVNQSSDEILISDCSFFEICENLMDALSSVNHRGTFTSILLAFMKCCTICFSGNLRELPKTWLQANLKLVKTKKQLISRRSAGLPFLISGILVAASSRKKEIEEDMNLAFNELLAIATESHNDEQQSSVDLPQVNAFNCMTQIFKESALRDHYKRFLCDALNASLDKLNHPVWAIKNGALMLFTALQNSFFGSNKLEDVTPSVKEELFFSHFPETKDVILTHLQNSSATSPNEAIPILSIVGRLQPSSNTSCLKPFIELIRFKYLGHCLWKIREIAAVLIANMTRTEDVALVVDGLCPSLYTPKNEAHGRLLCILELLRRTKSEFPQNLRDSFKEEARVRNFSKWFILEVYIRIMDVCNPNSVDLSIVKDAYKNSVNATEGLNGSSKLFIRTSVRFLLNHTPNLSERVALSKNIMATKLKEAIHETALYWQHHIKEFQGVQTLHEEVLELMRSVPLSAQVFKSLLELTARANCPVTETFDDSNWPDEWKCLNMAVKASSRSANLIDFTKSFRQFSRDDQPENVRIVAVSAARKLLSNKDGPHPDYMELEFLLHERESDDSPQVRELAVPSPFDFHKHIMWSSTFIAEFGKPAEDFLIQNLIDSIMLNVTLSREELKGTSSDIARENLYRNEVALFSDYAAALFDQKRDDQKRDDTTIISDTRLHDLCKCIEEVTDLVLKNRSIITSWTYNPQIDTAIRKISALRNYSKSEKLKNSSVALFEFLHASHYPLQLDGFS